MGTLASRLALILGLALLLYPAECFGQESSESPKDIYQAIARGDIDAVTKALDEGLDPNAQPTGGYSLLQCAVSKCQPTMVTLLLARGANPAARENDWTLLWAFQNCPAVVHALVEAGAPTKSPPGGNGTRGILASAAGTGDQDFLQYLLNKGADPNETTWMSKFTALHVAAAAGYNDMIPLLLKAGAMVDVRDGNGLTPLMSACVGGQLDAARLLLQAGADPCFTDSEGYSLKDLNGPSDPVLRKKMLEVCACGRQEPPPTAIGFPQGLPE